MLADSRPTSVAPSPPPLDTRSPYTSAEWAAIREALRSERARRESLRTPLPFSQADQSEVVSAVVRRLREAAG